MSQRFVDSLPGGLGFSAAEGLDLSRGVLVGKSAQAAYISPSAVPARSSAGSGFAPSLGWPLALVLLAAVLAGAGALAARRRG